MFVSRAAVAAKVFSPPRGLRTSLLVPFLLLAAGSSAKADILLYATLTHEQESAPVGTMPFLTSTGAARPASFGTATFVLNDAMNALTFNATIFNIDVTGTQTPDTFDNLVNAHIHAPAPPGSNASVVWGFFGTPDNDNNPDNLVVTPFASGVGGTFSSTWNLPEGNGGTNLALQIPNILAGQSYINFHTVQFGPGEIRGQITTTIPEPGTLALIAGGALPLLGFIRRRRGR